MQSIDNTLAKLEEQIQQKHLLKHDFYKAWSEGKLSRECLKEYAMEYYHHVKAFPTYLSALHSQMEDAYSRKHILQNLIEEESGSPNHPDLWKAFALNLGASEEELESHTPCKAICQLIDTFRSICREETVEAGLAALLAYESQIPAICHSKIDGLKKHYGMSRPEGWRYFSIHIAADEEHSRVQKELLMRHMEVERTENIHKAAERILDALWDFLSHMAHKYQIAC